MTAAAVVPGEYYTVEGAPRGHRAAANTLADLPRHTGQLAQMCSCTVAGSDISVSGRDSFQGRSATWHGRTRHKRTSRPW